MRIKRTDKEWSAIIEQQKKSGCPVASFCRGMGIHPNVFYRKQKELRSGSQRFIRVRTPAPIDNYNSGKIRIGKIELEVQETISDGFLSRLMRCAMEANDAVIS